MIELSEEMKMIRDQTRRLVEKEIIPREMEIEEADHVPEDIVKKLREMGYFGIKTPPEYGGMGLGLTGYCVVQEELGRTHPSINFMISGNNSIGSMGILYDGTAEQKKKYLPKLASGEWLSAFALTEPGAGSDAAAISTRADKKGDRWILNGMKHFITRADIADVFTVMALSDKQKRAKGGITAFIVEKGAKGLVIGKPQKTMGSDTIRQCEVYFDDCEVPETNVIGEVGWGFKVAMKVLEDGRVGQGARAVGAAKRMLDMSVSYAKQRVQFGKPIAENQAIQWMLADMEISIHATELMVQNAARMKDSGQKLGHIASIVKVFGTEMVNRVADSALQIHGGMGYMKECPIEFFYREVRLMRIVEGTSEIQRQIIARSLLKD